MTIWPTIACIATFVAAGFPTVALSQTEDRPPRTLSTSGEKRCRLNMVIPEAAYSIACSGDLREEEDALVTVTYFRNQFVHNGFARYIEAIVSNDSLDEYLRNGASGDVLPIGSRTNASPSPLPDLTEKHIARLCAKTKHDIAIKVIEANGWRGYVWQPVRRIKRKQMDDGCPGLSESTICFTAILGNETTVLHFSDVCIFRNGKKTDPAEFDADDFMKMIYSITFDTLDLSLSKGS
ncbi:hypothetical protein MKD49_18610 [Herbaspirillum sp. WGmk3]|uniref:hypothetical protein n=1 Tax=Herbaspirillum sp. WGmk3 TaxID=2919925 RepID=UPI002090D32B|nr:hypothetical protein [Herbaspirillum sp. WGmk3]MCO4858508.1 hypothetical protein [Herbaspirillum sp. WGmk3]